MMTSRGKLPELLSGDCRPSEFPLTLELWIFAAATTVGCCCTAVGLNVDFLPPPDPENCFLNGGFGETFFNSFLDTEGLCSSLSESEGKSYNENL